MYFDPVVYQTAQLQLYYNNAISKVAQYIKKLVVDTFDLFPNEENIKFGIADIMEELKPELRTIEREKVRYAIEKELKKELQSRTHYTLFSRRMAESNPNYFPLKNGQNKVHYTFSKFEAETWKSTNDDF